MPNLREIYRQILIERIQRRGMPGVTGQEPEDFEAQMIARAHSGTPEGMEFKGRFRADDVPVYEELGLEDPYIDPTMAMSGAVGAGLKLGVGGARLGLRALLAGAADYPVGAATEAAPVPEGAKPFVNVGLGIASGVFPETGIEKALARMAGKIDLGEMIRRYGGSKVAGMFSEGKIPRNQKYFNDPVEAETVGEILKKTTRRRTERTARATKTAAELGKETGKPVQFAQRRLAPIKPDLGEPATLKAKEPLKKEVKVVPPQKKPVEPLVKKKEKALVQKPTAKEAQEEYRKTRITVANEAKSQGYTDEEIQHAAYMTGQRLEVHADTIMKADVKAKLHAQSKKWIEFGKTGKEAGPRGGISAIDEHRDKFIKNLESARKEIAEAKKPEELPAWVKEQQPGEVAKAKPEQPALIKVKPSVSKGAIKGKEPKTLTPLEEAAQKRAFEKKQGKLFDEAGFAQTQVAQHLAGAGVGAVVGYKADEENPVRGALIGAALGASAPTAIRQVIKALKRDPNAFEGLAQEAKLSRKISNNEIHKIIDASIAADKKPDAILREMAEANKKYKLNFDLNEATSYMAQKDLAVKVAPTLRKKITEDIQRISKAPVPERTYIDKSGKVKASYIENTSINKRRIDSDGAITVMEDLAKGLPDKEVIPHKVTIQMAKDYPWLEHKLIKTKLTKDLAAKVKAAEITNASVAHDAKQTILKVKDVNNPSEKEMAEVSLALNRGFEVMRATSTIKSDIGRALGIMRETVKNADIQDRSMQEIVKLFGGREVTEEMVKRLAKLPWDDPKEYIPAFNKFIHDVIGSKTSDKVYEAWINALLSSPVTHIVNTVSNFAVFLSKYPEKLLGASFDLMKGGNRERFFGEVINKDQLFAAGRGMLDGVRKGIIAFNTEMPSQQWGKLARVSKVETFHPTAIKGKTGKIVRLPGRLLMAADEFWKAVNYQTELSSLAYRSAVKAGKEGLDRTKHIADILANPKKLGEIAETEMLYRVFQQELKEFGKIAQRARQWAPMEEYGLAFKPIGYIMPFLRTPINIAKFGLERTPANFLRIGFLTAKGALKGSQISDELAKATMGSAIGAGMFLLAKEGLVTGSGPKNKADRAAFYQEGKLPYAIKMFGKWRSYQRLEPLGSIVGMAADFSETFEQMKQGERFSMAGRIVSSVARNVTSKTFMRGLSDFMNAAMDPERYGDKWLRSISATFAAPRLVSTLARATDKELRKPKGGGFKAFVEQYKLQIPGLRQQIIGERNLWGEKIETEGTVVGKLISPFRAATPKGDKIDKVISALNKVGLGRFGKPGAKFRIGRRDYELTPEQHDRLIEEAGKKSKERLDRLVKRASFDKMSDERKHKMIKRIIYKQRDRARRRLARELRQAPVEKKRLAGMGG